MPISDRSTTIVSARPFRAPVACVATAVVLSLVGCGSDPSGAGSAAADDAGPNPAPAAQVDILAAIDLRTFPAPEGAKYPSSSAAQASFMLPAGDLDQTIKFYTDRLTAAGWTPSTDPKLWAKYPTGGAQLLFTKQGHRLYGSLGVSPADGTLNAGLFHLGNLDARKLPRPAGAETVDEHPQRVIFKTTGDWKGVRTALAEELKKLGWIEFARPIPKGLEEAFAAQAVNELHFVQRGMGVDVVAYEVDGARQAAMTIRVLADEWPLLRDPRLLEMQDEPLAVFYVASVEEAQAAEFYRRELPARGWKERPAAPAPKSDVAASTSDKTATTKTTTVVFEAAGRPPIRLELLRDKTLTFVRLTSQEDR